jgi:hypothetical protein
MTYRSPSPIYLGPVSFHGDRRGNRPIRRIVIHMTVSPCVPGGARATAAYFRSPAAGGSAHYVVDPGEVVQAEYDSVVCYHDGVNTHELGVEMCGYPESNPVKAALNWAKPSYRQTLNKTARLTAQLLLAEGLPVRFLKVEDLGYLAEGVTTHANESLAFKRSTHWDPGVWPRRRFMRKVRKHVKRLRGGNHG